MNCLVLDSSVVLKWFLEEEHSEAARKLRHFNVEAHVPDLIFPELGNALWKRVRRAEFEQSDSLESLQIVAGLGFVIHPAWPIVLAASAIAAQTGRTVYDSMYVALSLELECPFVTGDARLRNDLLGKSAGDLIIWVGDVPEHEATIPDLVRRKIAWER